MSHLPSEVLWDAAKAPSAEQAEHLLGCAECKAKVDLVRSAQSQLIPTPVPPLPMTSARRIGRALEEAAQRELGKKTFAWWPFSFSPNWALAAVAAALLAVLAARVMAPSPVLPPEPVAHRDAVTPPAPIAMPVPPPPVPAPVPVPVPAPKPQLAAAVLVARKASTTAGALDLKAELKAGDTVATAKGGELWMRLPDGSRAGLTPNSKLSIGSLTEDQLVLELDEGSVVMVARHLPQRELKVTVGELEVRDVGTRFIVSRELNRAMVAVEEGVVEVKAPSETRQVKAGHLVRWQEGQLSEETYSPVVPAKKTVKASKPAEIGTNDTPPIPSEPQTKVEVIPPSTGGTPSPVAEAAKEPVIAAVPKPPSEKQDGSSEEEWQKMPTAATPPKEPPLQGKPVPATGGSTDAAVAVKETPPAPEEKKTEPAEEDEDPPGPLDLIKRGINFGVKQGKKLLGKNPREKEMKAIGSLADEGNCEDVLKRSDEWLAADPSDSADEPSWRRTVKVNQMRCYRVLHRDTEADAIKKELQK